MIRAAFICLFFVVCQSVLAQKVIDRSASKRPAWYGQVQEGFIIVSASAETMEEAQRKCLEQVKIQMLESVAQNIEFSTETVVEQITHNQDVQSDITFRQKGKTSVANLPYITGVSLSKAQEAYWEAVQDKQTKKVSYIYSFVYPYPSSEYRKLKAEFDEMDNKMTSIVQSAEEKLKKAFSVDSMEVTMNNLKLAEDYFFDVNRKTKTRNVIDQYSKTFRQFNVESKRIAKCKFRCWITWNGNIMECSSLPKCKSETATQIKCSREDDSYIISFSDEECIGDDDNHIDISFSFKPYTLKHKLYF